MPYPHRGRKCSGRQTRAAGSCQPHSPLCRILRDGRVELHGRSMEVSPTRMGSLGSCCPAQCPQRVIRHSPGPHGVRFAARASAPKITEGSGHEDSGVLLPSPGRHTCFPSRQGLPLLYRASALLSDDARQELRLGPCRLHILSVLFSNLCGKGGGE